MKTTINVAIQTQVNLLHWNLEPCFVELKCGRFQIIVLCNVVSLNMYAHTLL